MGRPCSCDRTVIGDPFVRGRDCGRCWLWHNSPRSRAAWCREGEPAATARLETRPPCRHLGPAIDGPRRVELKLAHAREWHDCGKGHGAVCPCRQCKTCPDYEPTDDTAE